MCRMKPTKAASVSFHLRFFHRCKVFVHLKQLKVDVLMFPAEGKRLWVGCVVACSCLFRQYSQQLRVGAMTLFIWVLVSACAQVLSLFLNSIQVRIHFSNTNIFGELTQKGFGSVDLVLWNWQKGWSQLPDIYAFFVFETRQFQCFSIDSPSALTETDPSYSGNLTCLSRLNSICASPRLVTNCRSLFLILGGLQSQEASRALPPQSEESRAACKSKQQHQCKKSACFRVQK